MSASGQTVRNAGNGSRTNSNRMMVQRWILVVPVVFSGQLSDRGLFTIGIERKRERLTNAKHSYGENERLAFMHSEITPATITDLPSVDVVLLLTVYHHWTKNFGQEPAENMLRSLASKSNKIFFEPPGHIDDPEEFIKYQIGNDPVGENESIQAYYEDLLSSIFDETVSVIHLGTAPYPSDNNRTDPVFMIECSQYEG